MNILENHIKSGEFSHAYLLTGDFGYSRGLATKAAEIILSPKDKIEAHPDFSHHKFNLFGIKDSHALRAKASRRPMLGDSKVFIIEVASFSIESANALLKMFEEPYKKTYFFVVTSFKEDVIPTLASRLTLVDNSEQRTGIIREGISDTYRDFLMSFPNKRIESVKKLFTERKEAIGFMDELEVYTSEAQIISETKYKILEEIQRSREFLYSKGSSPRMVLEHLSLVLPGV